MHAAVHSSLHTTATICFEPTPSGTAIHVSGMHAHYLSDRATRPLATLERRSLNVSAPRHNCLVSRRILLVEDDSINPAAKYCIPRYLDVS